MDRKEAEDLLKVKRMLIDQQRALLVTQLDELTALLVAATTKSEIENLRDRIGRFKTTVLETGSRISDDLDAFEKDLLSRIITSGGKSEFGGKK